MLDSDLSSSGLGLGKNSVGFFGDGLKFDGILQIPEVSTITSFNVDAPVAVIPLVAHIGTF